MFYMVLSSVVISFGGLIMRSLETSEPLHANFYRAVGLLAAVVTFLLLRYGKESVEVTKDIGWLGIIGGCLLASAGLFHMQAMAHTTIANALFILGLIPFFTAIFARVLLKEKLQTRTIITMVIAAIGLLVMVKEGLNTGAVLGNVMAISTATCFSLYAVIVRRKRRVEMLPTLIVSSSIIMIFCTIVLGGKLGVSIKDLVLCLVWGAVLSGVANFLFIYASRHLAAAEVTLFMLLEFALGPIWVWWFVNEIPTLWTIVGGVLIMFAVIIRTILELASKTKQTYRPNRLA